MIRFSTLYLISTTCVVCFIPQYLPTRFVEDDRRAVSLLLPLTFLLLALVGGFVVFGVSSSQAAVLAQKEVLCCYEACSLLSGPRGEEATIALAVHRHFTDPRSCYLSSPSRSCARELYCVAFIAPMIAIICFFGYCPSRTVDSFLSTSICFVCLCAAAASFLCGTRLQGS